MSKKGFTLIEMVVSISIISILFTVVISSIYNYYKLLDRLYEKEKHLEEVESIETIISSMITNTSNIQIINNTIKMDSTTNEILEIITDTDNLTIKKNNGIELIYNSIHLYELFNIYSINIVKENDHKIIISIDDYYHTYIREYYY